MKIKKLWSYFSKEDISESDTTIPFKFECPYTGKTFEGELPSGVGIVIPAKEDLISYVCGVGKSGVICQHFNYFLLVSGMIDEGVGYVTKKTPCIISNINLFAKEQSEKLLGRD